MKLFNTIIVWDVYVAAENEDDARASVMAHITQEGLAPSEAVAREATREREIREAWRKEAPLVGPAVSDTDFDRLKGKTTIEVHELLNTKAGADKEAVERKKTTPK